MLKVVHISFSDKIGGASIAAYRHNESLIRNGIDSKMLVSKQMNSINDSIQAVTYSIFERIKKSICDRILSRIYRNLNPIASYSLAIDGMKVHRHPYVLNADLIILHWINFSTISLWEIKSLLKLGKPVVWYCHDMWPFTGGCHYSFDCTKFCTICKDCNQVKKHYIDFTNIQFLLKKKLWSKYNAHLTIAAPSNWLINESRRSDLFKYHKHYLLPNVIDTELYRPTNKYGDREKWGLNKNKTIILFCADKIDSRYKGWEYLRECLNMLPSHQYECLVIGRVNSKIYSEIAINVTFTGYIGNEKELVSAYNASDISVLPSLADNYPNVIVESMACGVPCVAFDSGGIKDLVIHMNTGYLVKKRDALALRRGIEVLSNDKALIHRLSLSARKYIESNCSYNPAKMRYFDLYKYCVKGQVE